MRNATNVAATALLFAAWLGGHAPHAQADAVIGWNAKANEIVVESKLGTPPAIRVMALVQAAVHEGVSGAPRGASVDAVVASASRATLSRLLPAQQAAIDAAYRAALAAIADGGAKSEGVAAGERAAATVLAARSDDGPGGADTYRPHTTAGAYVPTAQPAALPWAQRRPWLMSGAAQFRPGPPPALASAAWARDYDEVKTIGARGSARRTPEQTEIARFWEYSLPPIYFGVVRSLAAAPGRDAFQNARLYAAAAQAMDDAMIAVFDAKYHYGFWRPSTAIRNGDIDGNDATQRDPAWVSFIEAPMHPEYPSAHSILAAAVGTVIASDAAGTGLPVLATSSPTAKGAPRRWASVDDFVAEVGNARIWAGIHFRNSTDVGAAMGRAIGTLAVERLLQPPH